MSPNCVYLLWYSISWTLSSSMVPLLIPGYAKVTLVDIRYLPADKLGKFVEFGNQDVLFLYSTLVLNQSSMLK